jgi:UDP-galactopyranose mutase
MTTILIVGAGFSGAVLARELVDNNPDIYIDLIDERDHIGGNAYDYTNKHGIRIHKYGPHLFHTNNEIVWNWISRYGEWVEYRHKVKALLNDGRYVTLPVNKETKEIVGEENVIKTFFAPYTYKMWGKTIEELDPGIIKRIPIRDDDNELYFPNDKYQFLPKNGYTTVFDEILSHKRITVSLSTPYEKQMESAGYAHIFNAMPIDEYFNYKHGELPYRSIKFHNVDLPLKKVLPSTVVNFTHDGPYTRMTEWKNMAAHGENNQWTSLTYEEPCDYRDNNMERYYPVKDIAGDNKRTYKKYKEMVKPNMTFIGRCGMYAYIDMHQAINSSLQTATKYLGEQ